MSYLQTNNQSHLCQECLHKEPTLSDGRFLCKLHEEHYLKELTQCEDFEEKDNDEFTAYECD